MNTRRAVSMLTVVVLSIAVSSQTYSRDPYDNVHQSAAKKSVNWKNIEHRYVNQLKSENSGVRISAANRLGAYHLEGAIGALTDLLTTDVNENARFAAAFALARLEEPKAYEALENAATNNDNMNVAFFCRTLISASAEHFTVPLRYSAER